MSNHKRLSRRKDKPLNDVEYAYIGDITLICGWQNGKIYIGWNKTPPAQIIAVINIYKTLQLDLSLQAYLDAALSGVDTTTL